MSRALADGLIVFVLAVVIAWAVWYALTHPKIPPS